jgi:hypothetical protein
MMNDAVWVSQSRGDTSLWRTDFDSSDPKLTAEEWEQFHQAFNKGLWQSPNVFTKRMRSVEVEIETLPDMFYSACIIVSERAAEVLSKFDLGEGGLINIEIVQPDGVTPVSGKFFCLNFGAQKDAFAKANSREGQPYVYKSDAPYLPGWGTIKDDLVAVSGVALKGADLWTDPALKQGVFFVSGRLHAALKEKNLVEAFRLYRCRIEG